MLVSKDYSHWITRTAAVVAVVFGVVTIRAGGNVLFGDGATTAGNIVYFVLWFNFLAGFAYLVAGIGLWLRFRWSVWVAIVLAASTVVVFGAFGIHVAAGGAFEARTVWAMSFRSIVWIVIALLACKSLGCGDSRRMARRNRIDQGQR